MSGARSRRRVAREPERRVVTHAQKLRVIGAVLILGAFSLLAVVLVFWTLLSWLSAALFGARLS